MSLTARSLPDRPDRVPLDDSVRRAESLYQLGEEDEARKRRVALRREQRARAESAARERRRKRTFQLAGMWAACITAGFMAATWFSSDFVAWLHSLRHAN